ncbi:MAG: adenylate/guanylate cyclase domain-containing protein, partial [Methylomonas sp.]|nr:adenylate/guanylate cyclase domain-containing protein [Methylomonas sp.]
IQTMLGEVYKHSGTLIKTIGDEIMCIFPRAEDAFLAACAMQNAVSATRYEGGNSMHIRIGFHYGEVIREAGDVFGDIVNVAARVASVALANQIMTSQSVLDHLTEDLKQKAHQIMVAEFKGKEERFPLFIVVWKEEDEQRTRFNMPIAKLAPEVVSELTLGYGGRTVKVDQNHKCVAVGRGGACEIVVDNDFASRLHARFELRFGKFIIVDESTNGTYLHFGDDGVVRISHEEMVLRGSGLISLGQAGFEDAGKLISFAIEMKR